jgi:hypothetical protein
MTAFEIIVNGHHIRTITAGDFGVLNADVMWSKIQPNSGPIDEQFRVLISGLEGNGGDAISWPEAPLKMGDTVTIRIIQAECAGDAPLERCTREEIEAKRRA